MQQSKYFSLHKAKALRKENIPRQIVEFVQFSTMVTSYSLYFESYSIGKKRMIWLIFIAMWKQIYINYQVIYLDSIFVEETLKDYLWDTLKELKIGISNEEVLEKKTLQCDQVLEWWKVINGDATRNILKRHQSLIDEAPIPSPSTLSSSFQEHVGPTYNPNPSLDSTPFRSDNEKLMLKCKCCRASHETWNKV